MKKLTSLILSVIFTLCFSASAFAIDVYIDNNKLAFEVPLIVENGTTLVPMRAIFENLGAAVKWDNDTATATGEKEGIQVSLTLNTKTAYINGNAFTLAVPAKTINDRTMVPLRFISESFKCTVDWNEQTQTITITSNDAGTTNQEQPTTKTYKVTRVVDGDTIVIDYNGTEEKVRFIGVDTPESVHPNQDKNTPYGKIASEFTNNQLLNKEITLEFDAQERDQYGRLLAYVYLDGKMFNKTLLEKGHAVVATFPPNVKYVNDFTAIQEQAQKAQVGVWEGYTSGKTETESKPTVKTSGKFVGSILSDKYHTPNCRFAKKIEKENEIWFDTTDEATKAGYAACGVCQ